MSDSDCSGPGRCHGCMAWCDRCGDVSATCDSERGNCDVHHCASCRFLLTAKEQDESYDRNDGYSKWCSCCYAAIRVEWQLAEIERHQRIEEIARSYGVPGRLLGNPNPTPATREKP